MLPEYDTSSSFAPSINQVSEKLDKSRDRYRKNAPRWQLLYEQKEEQKLKCEMRQKEKEENEQNEVENCSFRPSLSSEKQSILGVSVEQRTKDWNKIKNERLNAMMNMTKTKEMNECTFSPVITKKPSNKYKGCRKLEKSTRSFYGKNKMFDKEALDEISYKNAIRNIHNELLSLSIVNPNFN